MATLAELETALRNADAAGDADGARVLAAEYARMRSVPQAGGPTRPGMLERGARGVYQGLQDVQDAYKQGQANLGSLLGTQYGKDNAAFQNAYVADKNARYQQEVRGGQSDLDVGRLIGNAVGTLPATLAMPAGATLGRAALMGAAGSGAAAALQPVTQGDFFTEKARQIGLGAATGAVTGPLANIAGRMISPNVSPEIKAMRDAGVTPTPGQIMGGGFKSAEEKLSSVPVLGSAIRGGQQRAVEQFNTAAFNKALDPIKVKVPQGVTGRDAVNFAEDALGKAYDDALAAVGPIRLDQQMSAGLRQTQAALSVLPKDKADQFARIVQVEIGDRAQNGVLTPEAMKAAESNLGQLARGYMRSTDFDQRQLGEAILKAQETLRQTVERQAPAGAADMVRAANAGWAGFKRVQRAATYVGAEDGVFNPAQLLSATKATDTSKGSARFARGDALMQDFAEAGKKALGNKVPNSGTTDRALAAMLVGGPMAAGATLNPWMALGALPAVAYTPMGQRMAAGLLAGRQGAGAGLLGDAAARAGVPAGLALTPALESLLAQ